MALPNNVVPDEGTTFNIGSWIFTSNGTGGCDSHLAEPETPETSATTRHNCVDEFVGQLNEIPFPVHVEEIRKQSDFDVTSFLPKSLSELKEDLDHYWKLRG